ncbi:MAG: hypothetical protein ACRDBM_09780, partial [Sporomusa sp.]
MVIRNARVLTMEQHNYDKADVRIEAGKITQIAENLEYIQDEPSFNAKGLTLLPGFIDSHCHIGMFEDGMGEEGEDGNEMSDPVTPHLRAIDAINPLDRCFIEARQGGITTVVTGPGSANVLGGQFAALKTVGTSVDDMVIEDYVAAKAAL